LTIDNLLEADVVLASGEVVRASQTENEDLFWAIRGGGGNFGVITSFLFQAHPVQTVVGGPMLWPLEQTTEILRWYSRYHPSAPDTVYGFPAMLRVPPAPVFPTELHTRPVCGIVWCHSGTVDEGQHFIEEIRKMLPKPLVDLVGPIPFPALQSMFDPLIPPGLQWYWKGDFFDTLPDEAIAIHKRFGETIPMGMSTMHLYPVDGAVSRVPSNATAFSYREAKWSMVIAGIHPDPSQADAIKSWAQSYWAELHPYSLGGSYVNFLMDEGIERVRTTYRGNYERLQGIKARYDPDNIFRFNQNVAPARQEEAAGY
jgi:FAD/FMN-containing dehydrogenase